MVKVFAIFSQWNICYHLDFSFCPCCSNTEAEAKKHPLKQTNKQAILQIPKSQTKSILFLQNIWKRWNYITFHMAMKFSASLAENGVLLTEWPQIKQNLSWPYDHTILYLNWLSLTYYQEHSPNLQAQPLLSFLLYELCKSMQNIHES